MTFSAIRRKQRNMLNKKGKIALSVLTPIAALVLAFVILCLVTIGLYSPVFLGRVLTHWDSRVTDYKVFPERIIQKSEQPYRYTKNVNPSLESLTVKYGNGQKTLTEFVKSTDTASFIIVQNDTIVYEQYANGYDANSTNTSFSMAKSVVSLLIGKAIEKGCILSVEDPIANYIEEFADKEIGKTTIEELLLMQSNIAYDEDKLLWFGDDTLTYWHDNLRQLTLSHTELTDRYEGDFRYNNYHPLLLGIILERSTGVSVSQFFEREIWQKIGAEHDASWSLDSDKYGFEKMESGLNFYAVDFVKIGSMVLHGGYFNGTQVINGDWLNKSTLCNFPLNNNKYENTFLAGKNIGYKYMWYCAPSGQFGLDVIAWGKSDQIMLISPANGIVILRTGKTDGGVENWAAALQQIITSINAL